MIPVVGTGVTDALGWLVIGLMLAAWATERRRPVIARRLAAAGWGLFGVFWLIMIPRFALIMRSFIETILAALAVAGCLYAALLILRGRDELFTLTRAVAVMGLVYLPFTSIPMLRRAAVEMVAAHIYTVITWLGHDPAFTMGPNGYLSALEFTTDGHTYITHIVLQCTGIGSMSVFAGLVGASDAPRDRKLRAIALAVGIIYVLNVIRNVFIALAFGNQWFQVLVDPVMAVTGYTQPGLVSFFIADRVLAQSASVVALVGITWLIVRTVPELLSLLEEMLYVVTHTEYDLHAAFSIEARR